MLVYCRQSHPIYQYEVIWYSGPKYKRIQKSKQFATFSDADGFARSLQKRNVFVDSINRLNTYNFDLEKPL